MSPRKEVLFSFLLFEGLILFMFLWGLFVCMPTHLCVCVMFMCVMFVGRERVLKKVIASFYLEAGTLHTFQDKANL